MTSTPGRRGPLSEADVEGPGHLAWIPAGAAVGFVTSFLFGDLLPLAADLYYLLYFTIVAGFLALYVAWTGLDVAARFGRRLPLAVALGLLGGAVLAGGVLARPGTTGPTGLALGWDVLWRGVVYGTVDGLLLVAFPWIVAWRALGAERSGWRRRVAAGLLAYAGVLLVTTAYHLGYGDFRSRKILQPNVGATLSAVPTLLAANPLASPLSHAALHVTAVLHDPGSDLYLPPHRARPDLGPSAAGAPPAGLPSPAAASLQEGRAAAGLRVGEDRLAAGMDVAVSDSVPGDLMAAGGAVSVSGPVAGDLLAAGGSVSTSGPVAGSVRAAGGELTLSGPVGRNVTAAGGSVRLAPGAAVRGNVYVSGGAVVIGGEVDGHVRGSGGEVRILGRVDGSVDVAAERVVVGPGARIAGGLTHRSPEPAEVAPGARIRGPVTHRPAEGGGPLAAWIGRLLRLGAFLFTGAVLVALFPGTVAGLRDTLEARPWPSVAFGLVALAALPPALAVVGITLLGLPLALLGGGLLAAALYLARAVVAVWLGERLLGRREGRGPRVTAFLAGAVPLLLVGLLPRVGWAVTLLATLAGFGAAVLALTRRWRGGAPARAAG